MTNEPLSDQQKEAIRRIRQRQTKTGAIIERKGTPLRPLVSPKKHFPYLVLVLIGIIGVLVVLLMNSFQDSRVIRDSRKANQTIEKQENITAQSIEKKPLAVMVENSEGARPQSGLDKANIVYEVLAKGGITEFLAIYYDQDAEEVGPIRSARPYFVSKSLEHQAIYVHAGGSGEAYSLIREEKIDDINEFIDFQPFWRSTDRSPPNNLYSSTIKLRNEANKLGYIEMIKKQDYQFKTDINEVLNGRKTNAIVIPYNIIYSVTYTYDVESKKYLRFMNDEPHIDAGSRRQITVENIIIQFVPTKVIDEEGGLSINFIGDGKGLLFFKGASEEITWGKPDLRARTIFTYKKGDRIALTPGNVWIQIVPSDLTVKY